MSIRVSGLTKRYGQQTALSNLSFSVETGEVLGFLGPNGAGKSTTMRIMSGYTAPQKGEVYLDEVPMSSHRAELKRKIGYLPENNPLYTDMSVIPYLIFCARLQGIGATAARLRTRDMIRMCGLEAEKHKKISELSKGYRQRVGLAQAMIHDPQVLILDEPTSGLDPNQISEIRELIKQLGQEKTVILSSHILSEVEATCSRILILHEGHRVADGTSSALREGAQLDECLRIEIEAKVDERTLTEALNALPKVTKVVYNASEATHCMQIYAPTIAELRRDVFRLCVKNKWDLLALQAEEKKLEDIFKRLTSTN